MSAHTLDGSRQPVHLNERITFQPTVPLRGLAHIHTEQSGAVAFGLSSSSAAPEPPSPTAPLSSFIPAELPITLEMESPPAMPSFGIGGSSMRDDVATIAYQPSPDDQQAIYALLHEIHTPDGTIYDITLPHVPAPDDGAVAFGVGGAQEPVLLFPLNNVITTPPESPPGEVAFGLGDMVSGLADKFNMQHVLHVIKAPPQEMLLNTIAKQEPVPCIMQVARDGEPGEPLLGAESWRTVFPPSRTHRVLLFIHGFTSSVDVSLPRNWMRAFAPMYDRVLAYDHPTITRDPVQNATELLEFVPDDVQLQVDVLVHSRGGLVARSLVELLPQTPAFQVQRIITCGSPHGGTALAHRAKWDRLVSIALTAESMLSTTAGARAAMTFAPSMLESILRAASEVIFTLPGLQAMDPDSDFLKKLNAPSDVARAQGVQYAAVCSAFDADLIPTKGFQDALLRMSTQAFIGVPNDLVVPTASMRSIDPGTALLSPDRIYETHVSHFEYFDQADVQEFVGRILGG